MLDTKIAVVVREDLPTWQKLNVVAYLICRVVGANDGLIVELYEDAAGNAYNALMIQPTIILSSDRQVLKAICRRAMNLRTRISLCIEDMFTTGHDAANRAAVMQYPPDALNVVGVALCEDKKTIDKTANGPRTHP
jgi:hypothetical protein